ncbi:transcription factor MYB11-like isoform X2 [Phalaenopsis equestris]|uniref:transcription factor MYB11-like isoform X2 n=1 Tax=Phalaenopsis equestris TaxID=78828 RepID=UPI0009E32C8A|nr:transcription factor MYB11-like isoform X2 [Phalaenopsis equestris]XP_020591635.1 transcription factor MYB11-like isoform X2 [Phalaenopsis equestris]
MSERRRLSRRMKQWTPEEDEVLRMYVAANGEYDWRGTERLLKRSRMGCRQRWRYNLRSTVTQHPLTDEEKTVIWQLYENLGARFDTIRRRGDDRFPVVRTEFDIRSYVEQELLERVLGHGPIPNDVNDNGELIIDRNNEEAAVSPSLARNIDVNAPAPTNDTPD